MAKVGAPQASKKESFLNMQKDTIVKTSSILQRLKIPEGMRVRLENHFSPTGTSKTNILINRNPFE